MRVRVKQSFNQRYKGTFYVQGESFKIDPKDLVWLKTAESVEVINEIPQEEVIVDEKLQKEEKEVEEKPVFVDVSEPEKVEFGDDDFEPEPVRKKKKKKKTGNGTDTKKKKRSM